MSASTVLPERPRPAVKFRRPVCPLPMTALFAQSLVTPSVGLIFWKTVAFLIFLYILYRFGWGPITESLEEREEEIEHSIQRAEEALEEAKAIQAENEEARREAEQKAQQILREARDSAEELREEEKAKTRREIQEMKEQAQAEIEREKQAALQELRDEVADLAIEAAQKIIENDLDADRHRQLVDDALDDFPTN
ncbi:ATP synthase B chain [Salinibacter ruber M8]|nr:ATP synthase B chain [Salinibacter ruber M8]